MVASAPTVHVAPDGDEVITYPVIAEPPVDDGAVNVTVAVPDAVLVAETDVGESGIVAGVTAKEGVDGFETKTPLLAVASKVYAVPFERPETTHVRAGALT